MCESAKEIQKQWNYEKGDYILDPADGEAKLTRKNEAKKR